MKIAIDGPAGAGKSTLAQKLAQRLGLVYVDTGAMYRALTLEAIRRGIGVDEEEKLINLARDLDIDLDSREGKLFVLVEGRDVTDLIREPQVTEKVSQVSSYPGVRAVMVEKQRALGNKRQVIMDGRDIGECVLPDADFKFYITASLQERARRRLNELKGRGIEADYSQVIREIEHRDYLDAHREVGALKVLPDSIVIDTSELNPDEVVEKIVRIVEGEN